MEQNRIYTSNGEPDKMPVYPSELLDGIYNWLLGMEEQKVDRSDMRVALEDLHVDSLLLVTQLPDRSE
jgi:hypothetical protein